MLSMIDEFLLRDNFEFLDIETPNCCYNGHTFFSLFESRIKLLEEIAKRISEMTFEPYSDEIYGLESDNIFLRVMN